VRYVILAPVALLLWAAILFPVVASIYGVVKWRGGWRMASAVPLLVDVTCLALKDQVSLGFWALLYIPLSMVLSAYSGVVVLLHRKRAREASL
jgi:hypothetical protein